MGNEEGVPPQKSGYPTHNSGFGRKTVTFICNGKTISQDFEVFFPKEGTYHPPCSMCSNCPNWFYYWRDGGVCGIPEKSLYDGTTDAYGYCYPGLDEWIRLGSKAAGTNLGPEIFTSQLAGFGPITATGQGKGIKCVAEVVFHEQHHLDIRDNYHNLGDDPDGDGIPTSLEGTLDGMATHPGNPDTYNMKDYRSEYDSYGDNEIRCRKISVDCTIPVYPDRDWANPGCQHKHQFGPSVP